MIELLKNVHVLSEGECAHNLADQVDQSLDFTLLEALRHELLQLVSEQAVFVEQVAVGLRLNKLILFVFFYVLSIQNHLSVHELLIDAVLAHF